MFQFGDTITLRNIARSDGTVTTAVPAIVLQDRNNLLAAYRRWFFGMKMGENGRFDE